MGYDLSISGSVADPVDGVYKATVLISKGKIEKVSEKTLKAKASLKLDTSQLIFPGFIDPHVHLREPGWEYKEDFLTGSKAALHGGVTTVGDMPNLPEPVTSKELLLRKIRLAKKALIDILHFGGIGSLPEIRELAPSVPAFKIYTSGTTGAAALSWEQIEEATKIISGFKKPITFHCEDQAINEAAKEKIRGENYPWKHCDERPPESEISAIEKVAAFCRKYNAKANIAHISTPEGVKIASENENMTCEVTPHHLFFRKEDMRRHGNMLKVNPPLRSDAERRALLRAAKKGRIDMLATDHAPHTLQEKLTRAPSGMPGLDTYGNFALWLMLEQKIKPEAIARITSYNAAKYFALNDRARIKEGFAADLVVLDKKGKTKIENKSLHTKCGWSAFGGTTFPGKILYTIKDGRITMNGDYVYPGL